MFGIVLVLCSSIFHHVLSSLRQLTSYYLLEYALLSELCFLFSWIHVAEDIVVIELFFCPSHEKCSVCGQPVTWAVFEWFWNWNCGYFYHILMRCCMQKSSWLFTGEGHGAKFLKMPCKDERHLEKMQWKSFILE